ncbi:putative transcriptional regulator [Methanomicrobium sp. W14]|uniref:winged helix-turn-helix domain-containing protein n=1 Tax=Methanomicrobium sp. W14 TaxID=2817839 RepID=UPI001AE3E88F|nr:winged helix-turn-helix domain-containing protein [Methanomicrobium sp. W14]MBP2134554.1 putative transcriptional regulator [Methanomicrobium sp. W14]
MNRQISLKQIERPPESSKEDIEWFCDSVGIGKGRDLENIAMRVIISLLENMPEKRGLPVEELAEILNVSGPRVNHHVRNLICCGLVYRHKQRIYIRGSSLRSMVREIRKDTMRILDDLEEAAAEIDDSFGIKNRE